MNLIEKEVLASKEYELKQEEIIYKGNLAKIVELTSDNVARVEAMISTDSDYKNASNDQKGINGKYIGSSSYWLRQLKEIIDNNVERTKEGFNYEKVLENLIIAIDNENSTHLNSDKKGRKAVKTRLLNIKPKELKELLKNSNHKYELINIIQIPIEQGEKSHFSFATKFCHYACMYLFKGTALEDNYSIYDNILSNALPIYIKKYLGIDVKKKEYEDNYNEYIKYIDNIRDKAEEMYGSKISRNGFDHLIWYYHKGRK